MHNLARVKKYLNWSLFLILDAILQETNYYKPLNLYSEIIKSNNRSSTIEELDHEDDHVKIITDNNLDNNLDEDFCLKNIAGHFSA